MTYTETPALGRLLSDYPDLDASADGALDNLDQFHIGGAEATDLLIASLALAGGDRVLDVGSGFGGAARQNAPPTGRPGPRLHGPAPPDRPPHRLPRHRHRHHPGLRLRRPRPDRAKRAGRPGPVLAMGCRHLRARPAVPGSDHHARPDERPGQDRLVRAHRPLLGAWRAARGVGGVPAGSGEPGVADAVVARRYRQ